MAHPVLAGLQFLYLEDDPEDACLLVDMLHQAGVRQSDITICDTVDSALMAIQYQPFDVVLCDYYLGRCAANGYRTAYPFVRRVLAEFPHLPVILTSQVDEFLHGEEIRTLTDNRLLSFLPKRKWSVEALTAKLEDARAISLCRQARQTLHGN